MRRGDDFEEEIIEDAASGEEEFRVWGYEEFVYRGVGGGGETGFITRLFFLSFFL